MRTLTNVISEIAHRLLDLLPSHKSTLSLLAQVGRKRRGRILGKKSREMATNVKSEELGISKNFLEMTEKDVLMLKFIMGVSFPENLLEGTMKTKADKFLGFMKKNQLDTTFDLDHTAIFSEVPKPLLNPAALKEELATMNTQVSRISVGKKVLKRVKPKKPAPGESKQVFNLHNKDPASRKQQQKAEERANRLEGMFKLEKKGKEREREREKEKDNVLEFAPVAVEFIFEKPRSSLMGHPSDLCDPPIGIRILQQLFSYGRLEVDHPDKKLKEAFPGFTINFGKGGSQRLPWMQKRQNQNAKGDKHDENEEDDEDDEDDEESNKVGGEEDTVYISNLQLPTSIQWLKVETVGRRRPVIMDLFSPTATVAFSHKQRQEKLLATPTKKPSKKSKQQYQQNETVERVYAIAASIMVLGKRGDDIRAKRLTLFPATPGCAATSMLLVLMSTSGIIQTDGKWIRTVQFGERVLTLQHPVSVEFIPEIMDIKHTIKDAFDDGMDSAHTSTNRHLFVQRVLNLLLTDEWEDNPNATAHKLDQWESAVTVSFPAPPPKKMTPVTPQRKTPSKPTPSKKTERNRKTPQHSRSRCRRRR